MGGADTNVFDPASRTENFEGAHRAPAQYGGREPKGDGEGGTRATEAALLGMLSEVNMVSGELVNQLRSDPPALPAGFVEDVETLIRQNITLKRVLFKYIFDFFK